jgi:hypothetical protein
VIAGGYVKTPVRTLDRGFQHSGIVYIAFDALDIRALQPAQVTAGAHEHFNAMTARDQFVREVCADKAGCAGDEAIHAPP